MKEGLQLIHEASLPSSLTSITEVESLIDDACVKLELNEDVYGNVLIAVTEAVNNAIIHGNKQNGKLHVWLGVLNGESQACFSVKDQGNGFKPESIPDPTAPENLLKENGRGIFLMKNLSDELEFEEGGSRVNMYFVK